jgi:hypothetical protein
MIVVGLLGIVIPRAKKGDPAAGLFVEGRIIRVACPGGSIF